MTGNVYVHHQTGRADYHVTRAQYGFIDDKLYIEIDAKPSSEHGLAFLGSLALQLNGLPVGTSEITDCVGREFHLPTSQNDDPTIDIDRFTNLYLGEHYDVDENVITISNDNGIILEWIGVAPDVRFYDERAKDNRIELKCILESGLFQLADT